MNPMDSRYRVLYLVETVFLYLLSLTVIYCSLFFLSRINLFDLYNKRSGLWRLNPYLTLPYLIAILLGMVIAPLVWEKVIRRTDLKQIGFTIPSHLGREIIYGTTLFLLFVAYSYLILSQQNILPTFSLYIIIYLSIRWMLVVFGEEILYRGVIQRRLSNICGKYSGLILASVVFAFIGHHKAPLIDNLILRLPFGLILGYVYLRSHSLLIPIGMHWGFNLLFAAY